MNKTNPSTLDGQDHNIHRDWSTLVEKEIQTCTKRPESKPKPQNWGISGVLQIKNMHYNFVGSCFLSHLANRVIKGPEIAPARL